MRAEMTITQEARIEERRRNIWKRIKLLRRQQEAHMPGSIRQSRKEEEQRGEEGGVPNAEDVELWLPSNLPSLERRVGLKRGLVDMEVKLRMGQCADALRLIRGRLYAKRHLLNHRNKHVRGQRANTRSQTLIARLGEKINLQAEKYRTARKALISLQGEKRCRRWKELRPEDLRMEEEGSIDGFAGQKLGLIGTNKTRMQRYVKSMELYSKKTPTWIWYSLDANDDDNDGKERRLHEGE
jgi:hypothetical protein